MKKNVLALFISFFFFYAGFSQDQTINGNLKVGQSSGASSDSAGWGKRLYMSGVWDNSDPVWLARYNVRTDASELRVCVGDNYGASGSYDKFMVGAIDFSTSAYNSVLTVAGNGRVGINTVNPQATLAVNGDIYTRRVKITSLGWSDYVFDSSYRLMPLQEVADSIAVHKHLPGVPSANEVIENGLDVGEMSKIQQAKIEELTLYLLQQQREQKEMLLLIKTQREELQLLKAQMLELKQR